MEDEPKKKIASMKDKPTTQGENLPGMESVVRAALLSSTSASASSTATLATLSTPRTTSATSSPTASASSTAVTDSKLAPHNPTTFTTVTLSAAPRSLSVSSSGTKTKAGSEQSALTKSLPVISTILSSSSLSSTTQPSPSVDDSLDDSPNKLLQSIRSKNLPYPLPVPEYSQAVQSARASGNVLSERATIIRETVKFFLVYKYWWTSDDYDRIAELVVNEFPELRDPFTWPSQPCYSKVRLDLSMCARNMRRIAKNQEKRRGSHGSDQSDVTLDSSPTVSKQARSAGKSAGHGNKRTSGGRSSLASQSAGQMLPHTAHTARATSSPSSSLLDQKQMASLPYLLSSTANASPSSTVLPPVAHFLGHVPHSQGLGGIVFPPRGPASAAAASASTSLASPPTPASVSGELNSTPELSLPASSMLQNDKHDDHSSHATTLESPMSVAAALRPDAQLPNPLPVPPYSDKVMKARKMGIVKYERPLVIRETVLFFLSLKYWWSSVDYDRISDFVVDYFPELRDPVLSPNVPPNRRVRADLSQTARNIRRRELVLKKRDSKSPEDRFAAVGTVTMPTHGGVQAPTDFCNELLAAASIIESRTAAQQHRGSAYSHDGQNDGSKEAQSDVSTDDHRVSLKGALAAMLSGVHASMLVGSHYDSSKGILSESHEDEDSVTGHRVEIQNAGHADTQKDSGNTTPAEGKIHDSNATTISVVASSDLPVIKHEAEDEETDDYSDRQHQEESLQAHMTQAWESLSAQMSQALSMQALSAQMSQALSAQMSQALSASHISQQLMSAQLSAHTQQGSPPAAHQMVPTTTSPGVSPLSLQQLSQAHVYSLASSVGGSEDSLVDASHADRMSAMAMWRSTCLPDPLPAPPYSLNVLRARDSGNTSSARPRIIRETTQFFLAMKMWWTTQDYERIAELVLRHFPALKSVQNVKKDLGTCARNMRRRLPISRCKPPAYSSQQWSGFQSPTHSLLKDNGRDSDSDGQSRGAGLTLGELATMASLREAVGQRGQDKGMLDVAGLTGLTEEQGRALLAQSMYEQSTLAWNALYQQQFGSAALDTANTLSPARGTKRSLSDTKVTESREKETLAAAVKRHASIEQTTRHQREGDSSLSQPLDSPDEEINEPDAKTESTVGSCRNSTSDAIKVNDMHTGMRQTAAHHSMPSRDQRKQYADSASFQYAHCPSSSEGLVHAHQNPVRAHSQSISQLRHEPISAEEAPINLTCTSEASRQQQQDQIVDKDVIKTEPLLDNPKRSRSNSGDSFNAREQVWFPHGSPWKKSGQNLFKSLPNPLPLPKYSQKLVKALEEGLAYRHRSEIIRETARFFLGFKYWWSSADYSRISELVVAQFPDLKDPVIQPGQPVYRRVQRDLSMCARNLRRKNTRRQKLALAEAVRSPKKAKIKESKTEAGMKNGLETFGSSKRVGQTNDFGSDAKRSAYAFDQGTSCSGSLSATSSIASVLAQDSTVTAANSLTLKTDLLHKSTPGIKASLAAVTSTGSKQLRADNSWTSSSPAVTSLPSANSAHHSSIPATVTGSSIKAHLTAISEAASRSSSLSSSLEKNHISGATALSAAVSSTHSAASPDQRQSTHSSRKEIANHSRVNKPATISTQGRMSGMSGVDSSMPKTSARSGNIVKHKSGNSGASVVEPVVEAQNKAGLSNHMQGVVARQLSADVRSASNTTAIVTPTFSEAPPTSDSRNSGGSSISQKVYIDPDHGTELQAQLTKLWQDGKFFDASLEVDGCRLPVHKLVLLAVSPYLQSTFRHANPTSQLEVNLPRATGVRAARDFLKYVYQGVLHVGPDTVHALRRIATMLQMEKLLGYCDDYLTLLNTSAASSMAHSSIMPHATAQAPKVSVNLRDISHSHHSFNTDQGSSNSYSHSSDATQAAQSPYGLMSQSGDPSSHRRRPVTNQSYHLPPVLEHTVRENGEGESNQKAERQSAIPLLGTARRSVLDQGSNDTVLTAKQSKRSHYESTDGHVGPSIELNHHAHLPYEIGDYHQFRLGEARMVTVEQHEQLHQALVHHLQEQERLTSGRTQNPSVIQRGPNVASSPTVSHMGVTSASTLLPPEEVAHFLAEPSQARHLPMHLHGDEDKVTSLLQQEHITEGMESLLPHTEIQGQEGCEGCDGASADDIMEKETLSAAALHHLTAESGDVVEEVVVSAGDLLQDVDVAACETVECSLLPQTYCSSPEASPSHTPTLDNSASPSLSSLAAPWPSHHFKSKSHFPWASLQEKLYSQTSPHTIPTSSNVEVVETVAHDQHMHEVGPEDWPEERPDYHQHCLPATAVFLVPKAQGETTVMTTEPNHVMLSDSSAAADGHIEEIIDTSHGSLLPQTYCSSPERATSSDSGQ